MSCFIWQFFLIIQFYWIFITLHHGCSVTGSYIVISREKETWLNASRICKNTYRGKLISSVEGSRQKMECLSNYTSNDEIWSRNGLILSPFLSHEGCFHIINDTMIQRISKKFNSIQSVGECYIYCQNRTNYFGIKNDTCYCISMNDIGMLQKSNRSACNNMCKDSTYDKLEFCGGRMALNLYRKIRLNGSQGSSKCAVINCTSTYHLSVQSCDSKFHYVCAGKKYQNDQRINFTRAASLCKDNYTDYLSHSVNQLCDTNQSQYTEKYWLDVRRYWTPSSDIQINTTEDKFKCGYFPSGISFFLQYEGNCVSSSNKRRFACEIDNSTNEGNVSCSLISMDKPAIYTTTQLQSRSTQLEFSTFTTSISTDGKEETYTSDSRNTTKGYIDHVSMNKVQSGDSSAIIGAVVGVLVITGLVVTFIILLILRRRKQKQKESDKSEEIIESQKSKDNFKLEEKQNALQSHEIDQENRHYFQLEANPKHNIGVGSPPQEHLQRKDEYNEADDTVYNETGNDVYDHLNEKRKKKTDNEDMYHIANGFQSDNDEYQHIHSLKGVTNRESSSDYAKFNEDQYSAIQRDK